MTVRRPGLHTPADTSLSNGKPTQAERSSLSKSANKPPLFLFRISQVLHPHFKKISLSSSRQFPFFLSEWSDWPTRGTEAVGGLQASVSPAEMQPRVWVMGRPGQAPCPGHPSYWETRPGTKARLGGSGTRYRSQLIRGSLGPEALCLRAPVLSSGD